MSLNSISNVVSTVVASAAPAAKKDTSTDSKTATAFNETAAVYEKSSGNSDSKKSSDSSSSKKTNTADRSAIVKALKDDAEKQKQNLIDIVRKSMSGQASTWDKSQGLKSLFENLTLDADTIAQAKKDIAEDGYWGVKQTSDRILDFAKALSGDNPDKADMLLEAFKKGYKQATGDWGAELPSLCKDTYDAVVEKFQKWKDSASTDSTDI